jgi:uncharacterized membrane-anchored protein YitT (DUF2179 family)
MFKKKYSAKEIKLMIRNALLVVFGTMILACGTGVFLVQFDLVTGGMPGMAIILNSILVDSNGSPLLPIDVYIFILSWGLFFIGLFVLGKDFAFKTLISTLVYSPMFSISIRLVDPNVLGGYFYLAGSYEQVGIILSALFGGTCVGAGCAITFLGGGSTGGTDIIAFIICKFFKRLRSSIVIFTIDVLIVIGGVFVINALNQQSLRIVSIDLPDHITASGGIGSGGGGNGTHAGTWILKIDDDLICQLSVGQLLLQHQSALLVV